jgi:Xaa-Pro dipeptidase
LKGQRLRVWADLRQQHTSDRGVQCYKTAALTEVHHTRLADLSAQLADADAVFVSSPLNVAYLSGTFMEPHERLMGLALGRDVEPTLIVPALDAETARVNPAGLRTIAWEDARGPSDALQRVLGRPRSLAIEKDHITVRGGELLAELIAPREVLDASPSLRKLRALKSNDEVGKIEQAAQIVDRALAQLAEWLRPGITEVEVALELDRIARRFGSQGNPFETIVLGGPNAAQPHGRPTETELRRGDLVVVDVGARRDGYCADITRTFAIGEPDHDARRAYDIVRAAQRAGCAALKPGITCASVDQAAREVIESSGYGDFFIHRTGHGLGLEAHESPALVAGNQARLQQGQVVTIEPGIYLPGRFGVRIEDDLVITDDGARPLTHSPRELTVYGA